MWPKRYAQELDAAWARMRAVPSRTLEIPWGRLEYATEGSGQPVLMSHGIFGSHAEALGMIRTYFGDGALAIAPSRFGYFGSQLPPQATPTLQADVYASLLDDLGIGRVVAIGFSAGGPSIVEFGLRHPDRVDLLVLLSSALPRKPIPRLVTTLGPPLMKASLTDRTMWTFKTLMPRAFQRLIGVPKGFKPSAAELVTIREIGESMLPVRPRRNGVVFDTFVGNPHVNGCRLEEISAPTLLIHAIDDGLAPYQTALDAAARMPAARFRSLQGGHEFLGHEDQVRTEIHTALAEIRVSALTTQR
jgi:pimeloyl-ACP methyl ester carboxylesterase